MVQEPSSGSGQPSGSASGGDNPSPSSGSGNTDDKVAYETYRKTVDEVKKLKDKLRESQQQLDEIADREKKRIEDDLKDKQEWKTYAERKEKEYQEKLEQTQAQLGQTQAQLGKFVERDRLGKKVNAFLNVLDGQIDPRFYIHIPDDLIQFKPDSDEIDEITVTKAVDIFRKEYGDIIRKKGTSTGLPDRAPGQGSTNVTYEDWLGMNAADKKKHYAAMKQFEDSRKV